METIEKVLKRLSNLYDFNRKLQTYEIQTATKIEGQQSATLDAEKTRVLDGKISGRRKQA